jgi:hypothetical protein
VARHADLSIFNQPLDPRPRQAACPRQENVQPLPRVALGDDEFV